MAAIPFAVWLNVLGGVPLFSHESGMQPDGVFVLAFAVVGLVLVHRAPTERIGRLLCVVAVLQSAAGFATAYAAYSTTRADRLPFDDALFKLAGPLFVASYIGYTVWLPLDFPTGRAPRRWLRPIGWLGTLAVGAIAAGMVRVWWWPIDAFFDGSSYPDSTAQLFRLSDDLQQVLPWLALATLAYRFVMSGPVERQQLAWFTMAALAIVATTINAIGSMPSWYDAPEQIPWIPLSVWVAMRRHRLYDVDYVVRPSVLHSSAVVAAVSVYAVVIALGVAALGPTRPVAGFVATLAVVALSVPARDRIERIVEHGVYGGRRDPGRALAMTGATITTAAPADLLPALCRSIAEGARLPGATIVLDSGEQATHGTTASNIEAHPLIHAGDALGQLLVHLAPGERALSRTERDVVSAVLPVVAAAIASQRLAGELQRSRQQLVQAREEERRRLRRDLHDSLGPALAGIALELQAARSVLDVDRTAAAEMMHAAEGWARDAVDEIRRVVYGLRPPVLDQLGLVRAIRQHVDALTSPHLQVTLHDRGTDSTLPAAPEVAAYLIALEAITNVVRHAHATTCTIDLDTDDERVTLRVTDDGRGHLHTTSGVGLQSMRERATELGGTVTITPGHPSGTCVTATIPLLR